MFLSRIVYVFTSVVLINRCDHDCLAGLLLDTLGEF